MRTSGEQFGHAGGFEACFGEAHCGAEAGAACADYEGVVGVIDYSIVSCGGGGEGAEEVIGGAAGTGFADGIGGL